MEFLRVLKKMWMIILLILLVLIGVCVFRIHNSNDKEVYQYYQESLAEYKKQTVETTRENAEKVVFGYSKDADDASEMEDKEYKETALVLLRKKIDYVDGFSDAISNTANYDMVLNSSLYSGNDNYGRLNALKYAKDMKKVADVNVQIYNTTAVEKLMEFKELPVLLLLLMLFCVITFVEERDNGIIMIVRIGERGRGISALKRCMILFFFSLVCSFVFNSVIYGMYTNVYGNVYMNVPIQSSQMFMMMPLHITVFQFFIMYCLICGIAIFTIGMFAYLFVLMFRNYKASMIVIIMLILLEYVLYNNIDSNSTLCILRYVNIANILFPGYSYLIYENWGFNGFITDISTSTFIMTIVLAVISFCGIIYASSKMYPDRKKNLLDKLIEKVSLFWQSVFSKSNLFTMELYKTCINQKGFIIIALAIYLFTTCEISRGVNYSDSSRYVLNFYEQFSGNPADEECYRYIDDFKERLNAAKENANNTYTQKMQIKDMENALSKMQAAVLHVKTMREKGTEAVIVKPYVYQDILGNRNYVNQENINLVCVFVIILLIAGEFSYERTCGMYVLGRTSKERNKIWRNKTIKMFLITVCIWLLSLLMNWNNILSLYELNNLHVSLQSLIEFSDFPFEISILLYLSLCQIVRLFLLVMISMIVYGISFYVSYKISIALSMLLILPHVLYVLGVPFIGYLSMVIPLDFNRYWLTYGNAFKLLLLPGVVTVAGVVLYIKAFCRWRSL